jgi:hypothetical protein
MKKNFLNSGIASDSLSQANNIDHNVNNMNEQPRTIAYDYQ